MIKKIRIFVFLFLSCILLTACVSSDGASPPEGWPEDLPYLSESKRQEIEDAWLSEKGDEFGRRYNKDDDMSKDDLISVLEGHRYYGTYQEYDIIFCHSLVTGEGDETIGRERFTHSNLFFIYAYKDGKFCGLKDICEAGLISDGKISEIAELHRKYEQDRADVITKTNDGEYDFS